MLVLSRQRDETIMIGDDIEVTVVDIRGDKVRLGITAPKEISVHRKEVYDAIRRENRAAAQVMPEDFHAVEKAGGRGKQDGRCAKCGEPNAVRGDPPPPCRDCDGTLCEKCCDAAKVGPKPARTGDDGYVAGKGGRR